MNATAAGATSDTCHHVCNAVVNRAAYCDFELPPPVSLSPRLSDASIGALIAKLEALPLYSTAPAPSTATVPPREDVPAAKSLLQRIAIETADGEGTDSRFEAARLWMITASSIEVEGTWNGILDAIAREFSRLRAVSNPPLCHT